MRKRIQQLSPVRVVTLAVMISLSFAGLSACQSKPGSSAATAATPSPKLDKPKLALQITVDQFRGDLPTRYADRLGEGGLRYLL